MQAPRLQASLLVRELIYRLVCRHTQADLPNMLLYCCRRGGSTWLLNTIAAHRGVRYVGQPFIMIHHSRWRHRLPAIHQPTRGAKSPPRQVIHYQGDEEAMFHRLADDILSGRIPLYPSLAFGAPYFHRHTNRIVFQMTSGVAMAEWFHARFKVHTLILMRHPIPTSLSVQRNGWKPECSDFLNNPWFVDTHLTGHLVDLGRRIMDSGSTLEQHVLDWSLKMLVPLRAWSSGQYPDWLLISYEHLLTDPQTQLRRIADRCQLDDQEAMLRQVQQPSRTASPEQRGGRSPSTSKLGQWRHIIPENDVHRLLEIPRSFGIEAYRSLEDMPSLTDVCR